MYTAFFGLNSDPFSISPDPRFLFMSEHHRDALAHLLFGVEGAGGIILLTGDIGAGKTSISRRFLEQAPEHCRLAYIFNPRLNVIELLGSVCDEFGIAPATRPDRDATVKELIDPLNAFLLAEHAAGRNPILIIDEAQNLSAEVLEQLRLLTNLETDSKKLLQIVLIGQPELRHLLASPGLEQLAQRVVARFHLGALDEPDTVAYIDHRLRVAGLPGPNPFSRRALQRVHRLSGGTPRRINLLCGRALLGAYALGQTTVSPRVVDQAAQEVFGVPDNHGTGLRRRLGPLAVGMAGGVALTLASLLLWRAWPETAVVASAVAPPPAPPPASASSPVATMTPPVAAGPTRAEPPPTEDVATANEAAQPTPPDPTPSPELTAARLLPTENAGLLAIGPLWRLDAQGLAPCEAALSQQLQCYRTPRMTLNGLRQMDSPAVLRLHLPEGTGYAVLEGAGDQGVTLSAAEHRWVLPASALSRVWRGEYLSLWRTPPGQTGHLFNGYHGPAAAWMTQRLDDLQRQGALPASARSLKEKVEAFQRSRGIDTNGRATPTTLILLQRATDHDEPRLSSSPT